MIVLYFAIVILIAGWFKIICKGILEILCFMLFCVPSRP